LTQPIAVLILIKVKPHDWKVTITSWLCVKHLLR